MSTTDNGVNVQALLEAREVLTGAPDAAQFTWRASSKWEHGVHSTTSIQNFFGLGAEQSHKSEAVFDADHPEGFAAQDNGVLPLGRALTAAAETGSPSSSDSAVSQERSWRHVLFRRGSLSGGAKATMPHAARWNQHVRAVRAARLFLEVNSAGDE